MLLVDALATRLPPVAPAVVSTAPEPKRCERSAWIALGLAFRALQGSETSTVLLVTPFRDQANLLRKLARAHLSHQASRVRTGTVHVAQGQEADLVVFDLVDPSHGWLQGKYGHPERIFCVAFSRSRRQLVLLGDPRKVRTNPLLRELASTAVDWTPEWTAPSRPPVPPPPRQKFSLQEPF